MRKLRSKKTHDKISQILKITHESGASEIMRITKITGDTPESVHKENKRSAKSTSTNIDQSISKTHPQNTKNKSRVRINDIGR